jgi:hypothetical protein
LGPELAQEIDIHHDDANPNTLKYLKDTANFEFNPQIEVPDDFFFKVLSHVHYLFVTHST